VALVAPAVTVVFSTAAALRRRDTAAARAARATKDPTAPTASPAPTDASSDPAASPHRSSDSSMPGTWMNMVVYQHCSTDRRDTAAERTRPQLISNSYGKWHRSPAHRRVCRRPHLKYHVARPRLDADFAPCACVMDATIASSRRSRSFAESCRVGSDEAIEYGYRHHYLIVRTSPRRVTVFITDSQISPKRMQ